MVQTMSRIVSAGDDHFATTSDDSGFMPYDPCMALAWPDTSRGACPTVMLWHEVAVTAGIPSHVDWLLAREPEAVSPLLSFRLQQSLTDLPIDAVAAAERIQDHRTEYLTYEGPIAGNRGKVVQIASGWIHAVRRAESGATELELQWESADNKPDDYMLIVVNEQIGGKSQLKRLATAPSNRYK
jgi:hypothetical protein